MPRRHQGPGGGLTRAVVTRRQLWALVALTFMWGINWPMMKLSLREVTPLYFRAITMTGGALWLFLFYHLRGVRLRPVASEWRTIVSLGAPNMLGWHWFSILGVKELASGRAAILGFTMPIWTVLLGALVFRERLTRRAAFAAAAVAATVALLVSDELMALTGRPLGIVWMELGALCWAVGTLMMRRTKITLPVEALTVWMMALSAACLWGIAFASEPAPTLRFSGVMWLSLAYGVLINYGFAQIIWFGLARDLPPATSAMSIMAVPLIGTLGATLIVGEWPNWHDYLAIVFVMAAIAAVLLPTRKPA